jgi:serine/threonine-protein kinase
MLFVMGVQAPSGRRRGAPGPTAQTEVKLCPQCGAQYPAAYKVCPRDRATLELLGGAADDDPMIGEVLASAFCITGVLGEGGMGRVYEAEHVRLPRRYAVKVIASHLARHHEAVGRFEREAQAAARVVHPNVLDVVDVVRAKDGRPCIIAEFLDGEELGDFLDQGNRLEPAQAIEVCRQACRALTAAHGQGIVHRDLKPANLFMCRRPDGELLVKVLDFGVAKMGDGASLTKTGTVVGTPSYMAPEQARGLPSVDGRADVYSMGAVLYRMLGGRPPFDHDDPASILLAVVNEPPTPLRQLNPAVSPALERIVAAAMTKEPEHRYPSAAAFESALASYAKQAEVGERTAPLGVAPAPAPSYPQLLAHSPTLPTHSPTLPEAPQRSTIASGAPPAGPSVMTVVVGAALVGVAILALVGAILVLVSSRRDLGDSTGLLATLFFAIVATAGAAFAASMRQKR